MIFSETMSSDEVQRVLFDYAVKHRGENIDSVKTEFREVSKKIVSRELKETWSALTR